MPIQKILLATVAANAADVTPSKHEINDWKLNTAWQYQIQPGQSSNKCVTGCNGKPFGTFDHDYNNPTGPCDGTPTINYQEIFKGHIQSKEFEWMKTGPNSTGYTPDCAWLPVIKNDNGGCGWPNGTPSNQFPDNSNVNLFLKIKYDGQEVDAALSAGHAIGSDSQPSAPWQQCGQCAIVKCKDTGRYMISVPVDVQSPQYEGTIAASQWIAGGTYDGKTQGSRVSTDTFICHALEYSLLDCNDIKEMIVDAAEKLLIV